MKELADYYRAADVLVQGSLEEGLGFSPLEALACEVPVVASAVGGLAAHLDPVASLTPRRDAVAMASAILQVASNLARRARRRAAALSTWRATGTARGPFAELRQVLAEAAGTRRCRRRRRSAHDGLPAARGAHLGPARGAVAQHGPRVRSVLLAGLRHPALRAVDVTRTLSAPGPPCQLVYHGRVTCGAWPPPTGS
jgi:hypothetical protein